MPIKRNHEHAASATGSVQNCVLVPFDFGPQWLNGDEAITGIQFFSFWKWVFAVNIRVNDMVVVAGTVALTLVMI